MIEVYTSEPYTSSGKSLFFLKEICIHAQWLVAGLADDFCVADIALHPNARWFAAAWFELPMLRANAAAGPERMR